MSDNTNLNKARQAKNDEFYTLYSDIERGLQGHDFGGKVVYCPCDDYRWSEFYRYFKENYKALGLSGLIATHYNPLGNSTVTHYNGVDEVTNDLTHDGDFRKLKRIMYSADIVVTNPPFSKMRDFLDQLYECKTDFIIIAPLNAIKYKMTIPHIISGETIVQNGRISGYMNPKTGEIEKINNTIWLVNIDGYTVERDPLESVKFYNPVDYPKYDNYDAIEVSKTADIPMGYDGVMGIPISGLEKLNYNQYKIVDVVSSGLKVDGKNKYSRILIQRK